MGHLPRKTLLAKFRHHPISGSASPTLCPSHISEALPIEVVDCLREPVGCRLKGVVAESSGRYT